MFVNNIIKAGGFNNSKGHDNLYPLFNTVFFVNKTALLAYNKKLAVPISRF
jgi:hypothetical protein